MEAIKTIEDNKKQRHLEIENNKKQRFEEAEKNKDKRHKEKIEVLKKYLRLP